jgi:hypothetical protein
VANDAERHGSAANTVSAGYSMGVVMDNPKKGFLKRRMLEELVPTESRDLDLGNAE